MPLCSIGYAAAERLAQDGASVVISSRKQQNVDNALKKLKEQGLTVSGLTCHAGSAEDRTKLFEHVSLPSPPDCSLNCLSVPEFIPVHFHNACCILQACKEFGGVDILVSNAAVNPAFGPILDVWTISVFVIIYTSTQWLC